MRKIIFVIFFYMAGVQACFSWSDMKPQKVLVVAKPVSIKFVRFDSAHSVSPSYYKLKIREIEIIQGSHYKLPRELVVDIRANNGEAILNYDRVYLLLNYKDLKHIDVLAWERVISMACIPVDLIDERYGENYFEDKWGDSSVRCTFIRGYIPPPKQ